MIREYKITLKDKNDPQGTMTFTIKAVTFMGALADFASNFKIDEATSIKIEIL